MMNKPILLMGALLASTSVELSAQKNRENPNIVFVLADDMGIGDLGCYGQKKIKTPNIDQLAEKGLLFTNHYSGSTVSAPSFVKSKSSTDEPLHTFSIFTPSGMVPLSCPRKV